MNLTKSKNWRKVKLGEVASVLGGFAFQSSWFNTNKIGHPAIKIQNLNSGFVDTANAEYVDVGKVERDISGFRLERGDFLVAMTGATAGKVGLLTQDVVCYLNQRVGKFYSKNKDVLTKKFLYYSVLNPKNLHTLKKLADGSAQGNMSSSQIENVLDISLPENINEQKRIANILSAFDDKIELNNKISQTLEEMASAIFKEWFALPSKASAKASELSESWKVKRLGDVVKLNKGLSYRSNDINECRKGLPLINLKCFVRGGGFKIKGLKYYTGDYQKRHVVKPGQLIIAMTDLTPTREVVGRPALVPNFSTSDILISLDVVSVEVDEIMQEYLYFLMKRPDFGERMANSASGTTVAHLSKDSIENYPVIIPENDLLKKFHNITSGIFRWYDNINKENQTLSSLRDLLLPKLMSGEVRVKV